MAPQSTLWKAAGIAPWQAAWGSYEATVAALKKDKLVELDKWFREELPTTLHARDPAPFITQPELVKLMEWKLKKGKWRPQLMKFITDLSDKDVKAASTKALKQLQSGHVKAAVEALAALKGVGPATASAVLAAYDEQVPFMGDEALEALAGIIGARKYTLPHYLSLHEQLKAKAKWLTTQADDTETEKWTPQRVQLCLYAEAHASATPGTPKAEKTTAVKRKAPAETKTEAKTRTAVASSGDGGDEGKKDAEITTGARRSTRQKTSRM